jgi:biotin carboxylase
MKSIVFIETNKSGSSIEGIKAAKDLGYYVHLFTSREEFTGNSELLPDVDEIHLFNVKETQFLFNKIEEIFQIHEIDIIISFIDTFVTVAAILHSIYCNNNISKEAFRIMEDKVLTRNYFKSKCYSPYYFICDKERPLKSLLSEVKHLYPLVIKSPTSSGSRDVYLIYTESQMKNRIRYLRKKNHTDDLLIEEYLSGRQFLVEAIVCNGIIHIAAIIEQDVANQNKFIITGYSIDTEIEEAIYSSISDVTYNMLNELGLTNGNCHLELKLVNGDWKLIEINPRISGGAMNKLIEEAYGFNYAEQILRVYRGEQPELVKNCCHCIYAHFMTVNEIGELLEITGIEQSKEEAGIVEVVINAKKGQILSPPLSMGHRYAYVIAKGKTIAEARKMALKASEYIQFHLLPIS